MTAISLQATQNDIIRQVLNTQDMNLLSKIKSLFVKEEEDNACMIAENPSMTKQEVLAGLDEAFHELKMYREGKLELKPLEEVLDEL